jgi:hypothetical protein
LGGDVGAKKQTEKKNVYLLTVAVKEWKRLWENRKIAEKRERQ